MIKPKKSLGQHWLFDESALDKVLVAADLEENDVVLEIGPGLGSLTGLLIDRVKKVYAVEADQKIYDFLINKYHNPKLELIYLDIMQYNLGNLPAGYKVVANIPYYLTSNILRLLLEANNPPKQISLLVQKEVAERVVADPGEMSVLAFSVQYYAHAEITAKIPKELFEPPPKVDSAVLRIVRYKEPRFKADVNQLFRLVKAGFSNRRKKLKNSLAGGLRLKINVVEALIKESGVKSHARAQELSMEEWQSLYETFSNKQVL